MYITVGPDLTYIAYTGYYIDVSTGLTSRDMRTGVNGKKFLNDFVIWTNKQPNILFFFFGLVYCPRGQSPIIDITILYVIPRPHCLSALHAWCILDGAPEATSPQDPTWDQLFTVTSFLWRRWWRRSVVSLTYISESNFYIQSPLIARPVTVVF